MLPRRFHSKSRNGCRQCKTSRVKCDEGRPTCEHCARRHFPCDYSAFRHLRSVTRSTAQTQARLSESPKGNQILKPAFNPRQDKPHDILHREADIWQVYESNILSPQGQATGLTRNKFELRLIYAFISLVAPVQARHASAHAAQEQMTNLPLLAIKYVYARDIILGYSAMYLRAQNPKDSVLVEASHAYAVRAIAGCSMQIQSGVHEGNAEGLFFASMFVAKHALASRQYDNLANDNTLCKQDALPLLRWFRQFRGIKAVLDAGWAWIPQNKHLSPMLHALAAPLIKYQVHTGTALSTLLEGLDETYTGLAAAEAYRVSVEYLASVIEDPNLRGLTAFPFAVPNKFIELLEERDSRAMAIIGWYLALLSVVSRSGILMLVVKQEYRIIKQLLPPEWLPKLDWATVIIEDTNID